MPTRSLRRIAAPLLVMAGAALFWIGAGGIARVDSQLEAASPPVAQPPPPIDVRDERPHRHRGEF